MCAVCVCVFDVCVCACVFVCVCVCVCVVCVWRVTHFRKGRLLLLCSSEPSKDTPPVVVATVVTACSTAF